MSHDAPVKSASSKLVIRNIGLLLSGDLEHPILDADTVVAIDGVINAVGQRKRSRHCWCDDNDRCQGHGTGAGAD